MQDPALGPVELHEIHMVPLLKPVKAPPDGIPSLRGISCAAWLGVIRDERPVIKSDTEERKLALKVTMFAR